MIVLQVDSAEHDFPSSQLHSSQTKETCAETVLYRSEPRFIRFNVININICVTL